MRIAEKLVADAKEAAARIKAKAKAEALERTQQQTDEWEFPRDNVCSRPIADIDASSTMLRRGPSDRMGWMAPAPTGVAMRHIAVVYHC